MYGITIVNSAGFFDGRESINQVGTMIQPLAKEVYKDYFDAFRTLEEQGRLDDEYDKPIALSSFVKSMMNGEYVILQAKDYHIQYEPWEF